jgi:hypothetical protein
MLTIVGVAETFISSHTPLSLMFACSAASVVCGLMIRPIESNFLPSSSEPFAHSLKSGIISAPERPNNSVAKRSRSDADACNS